MNCRALIENDILILENNRIRRCYHWNGGYLISDSLEDKAVGHIWPLQGKVPDCTFPESAENAIKGSLEVAECASTSYTPEFLRADVTVVLGTMEVKRSFRIYPDCPAIACDYFMRGSASTAWRSASRHIGDLRNIEDQADLSGDETKAFVLERVCLPGRHWRVSTVQFYDITDRRNTLVRESSVLVYRHGTRLTGNLLFADNLIRDIGIFILKEAPCSDVQLSYPGCDFVCKIGEIKMVGIGMDPDDLNATEWTRCYGFVTGVTKGGEYGRLKALRTYQERIRVHMPDRDEMIMMNTWGDRGQDTRISESFALAELEAGARLGITHFQLDAGWQSGKDINSAFTGESLENIWDYPDYWKLNPKRFPNGLAPVLERGKKLGIEVCVWFNPSADSSYAHWEDDANVLIRLHREYGIRTFKIDGVKIPDKLADENLRRMFDTVMDATESNAVFNLDVTAGRRYGYHYFNEYGNIFLENRYTDWSRYYPHWTLRNLWMLSRYVPPQNLQIEFLNKWRNKDNYEADDPFAPFRIPFDYIFAVTIMGQPLAWLEGTGLPEEAFGIAPMVRVYRKHQNRIHAGQIFPIGDEPCGRGWTGFQSIRGDAGYFLVFREYNRLTRALVKTWNLAGQDVKCHAVLGHGSDFTAGADKKGHIPFSFPDPYSFALYSYTVK